MTWPQPLRDVELETARRRQRALIESADPVLQDLHAQLKEARTVIQRVVELAENEQGATT